MRRRRQHPVDTFWLQDFISRVVAGVMLTLASLAPAGPGAAPKAKATEPSLSLPPGATFPAERQACLRGAEHALQEFFDVWSQLLDAIETRQVGWIRLLVAADETRQHRISLALEQVQATQFPTDLAPLRESLATLLRDLLKINTRISAAAKLASDEADYGDVDKAMREYLDLAREYAAIRSTILAQLGTASPTHIAEWQRRFQHAVEGMYPLLPKMIEWHKGLAEWRLDLRLEHAVPHIRQQVNVAGAQVTENQVRQLCGLVWALAGESGAQGATGEDLWSFVRPRIRLLLGDQVASIKQVGVEWEKRMKVVKEGDHVDPSNWAARHAASFPSLTGDDVAVVVWIWCSLSDSNSLESVPFSEWLQGFREDVTPLSDEVLALILRAETRYRRELAARTNAQTAP